MDKQPTHLWMYTAYLTATIQLGVLAIFSFLLGILFIYNYLSSVSGKIFPLPPALVIESLANLIAIIKLFGQVQLPCFTFSLDLCFLTQLKLELDLEACSEEDRHGWLGWYSPTAPFDPLYFLSLWSQARTLWLVLPNDMWLSHLCLKHTEKPKHSTPIPTTEEAVSKLQNETVDPLTNHAGP